MDPQSNCQYGIRKPESFCRRRIADAHSREAGAEKEVLKNPERIDTIARNELGMAPLRPYQIILPKIQDAERSVSNELAMTDVKTASMKRFVAAKHLVDYSD